MSVRTIAHVPFDLRICIGASIHNNDNNSGSSNYNNNNNSNITKDDNAMNNQRVFCWTPESMLNGRYYPTPCW